MEFGVCRRTLILRPDEELKLTSEAVAIKLEANVKKSYS